MRDRLVVGECGLGSVSASILTFLASSHGWPIDKEEWEAETAKLFIQDASTTTFSRVISAVQNSNGVFRSATPS